MNTYITAYPAHSLGRWLATLAVSLVLLALAYAYAPDPTGYLGLDSHSPRSLAQRRSAPAQRLSTAPVPALASTQLGQPTGRTLYALPAR
jgi:hypothetical protein